MSKYEIDKPRVKWSRMAPLRVIGYLCPVIMFPILVLWFRPQNEVGWVIVGIAISCTLLVPLATFSQARNDILCRQIRHSEYDSLTIFEQPEPSTRPAFAGPHGEQTMEEFLASQP